MSSAQSKSKKTTRAREPGESRQVALILRRLREHTSHDFAHYKQSTLIRRIQRRMARHRLASLAAYARRLQEDPTEVQALFSELLIGVTQFFRDEPAFRALAQKALGPLVAASAQNATIRVWVPGCSTGEEAYSLAMLLTEQIQKSHKPVGLQIFATDLDDAALEVARKALYPAKIAEQISADRLAAFFQPEGRAYKVREEIRSKCVFSLHNLIKDPPFSRLDLISCRNLLIYLESSLQQQVIPLFYHALSPGGFLFLGPSENFSSRTELFQVLDKKHRIFQGKPGSIATTRHLSLPDNGPVTRMAPAGTFGLPAAPGQNTRRIIEHVLLEDYAPPGAVISSQGDVIYFFGRTAPFLEPQAGAPSTKLAHLVPKGLRLDLRTATHQAMTTHREVRQPGLSLSSGRSERVFDLLVRPLPEAGRELDLYIVLFLPHTATVAKPRTKAPKPDAVVIDLQEQLRGAREDLQATVEELETSNENLKSANEELLSMNEELHSTNEELQTSKEELQASHEELQRKHAEVEATEADLRNLIRSSQVATLFVDAALLVKRFTPDLARLLPGVEEQTGLSPLPWLRRFQPHAPWQELLVRPLRGDEAVELRIETVTKRVLLVRATAYRDGARELQGTVLTFTDITAVVVAEREHDQLASIVQNSSDAIIGKDLDGIVTSWNAAAERMYGYTAAEVIGKPIQVIVPNDRYAEENRILARIRAGEPVENYETVRRRKDGVLLEVALTISPIRDGDGRIVGASKIARDITQRRLAGEAQRRLAAIVTSSADAILSKDLNGIIRTWNEGAQRIFGYTAEEMVGKPVLLLIPEESRDEEPAILERIRRGERIDHYETIRRRKDGTLINVSLTVSPVTDETGKIVGASKIARDITEAKRAEAALAEARAALTQANESLEARIQERTAELLDANSQLETLVYSIAHDLRAPLRSMQAFSKFLLDEQAERLDESGRNYTARIARAAETMDRLVLDLLKYGQTARMEMPLTAVELHDVWSSALGQNEQLILETGAAIAPVAALLAVRAHQGTLVQVVANLLNNALKFVRPGEVPRIEAWSEDLGSQVRFWIRDHGIGIAPEHQDRIFRVFERLNPTQYGGTGIGLAIVRKGIERMGGEIGLESAPGQGTRFWIELPKEPAP